ncbi:Microtubule-associated protein Jupiter [Melipona quadrifasciata]|uniref:Microtubule-associated protein Jupiter n=2 Tax=Meliponini TaxID=83319 RepID=A0A0N0BBY5_9HYME|nr:Microtubule-associated protein Jupiter [Melipona quadrifasciata]
MNHPYPIISRVLKPPGGGSSDIFGAGPDETSPRRVKNHNQSQLGSALFGDTPNNSNSNETPRNKPGNDSYNRLFGPPDAPPTTPNAKNYMRSNISLSGESTSSSVSSGAATSPAKSTGSTDSIAGVLNGYAASNGNNMTNDVTDGIQQTQDFSEILNRPVNKTLLFIIHGGGNPHNRLAQSIYFEQQAVPDNSAYNAITTFRRIKRFPTDLLYTCRSGYTVIGYQACRNYSEQLIEWPRCETRSLAGIYQWCKKCNQKLNEEKKKENERPESRKKIVLDSRI